MGTERAPKTCRIAGELGANAWKLRGGRVGGGKNKEPSSKTPTHVGKFLGSQHCLGGMRHVGLERKKEKQTKQNGKRNKKGKKKMTCGTLGKNLQRIP